MFRRLSCLLAHNVRSHLRHNEIAESNSGRRREYDDSGSELRLVLGLDGYGGSCKN